MTRADYRRRREQDWQELAELLAALEKRGWRRTPAPQLERLAALYRRAVSHLSQLRGGTASRRAGALNDLVVRAHAQIYRPDVQHWLARLADYFGGAFPRAVRATLQFQALAWVLLALGLALGWFAVARDPDLFYAIVPVAETRSPGSSVEELRESLVFGRDAEAGLRGAFSGFLWQHNVKVTLMVFAGGVLAGLPTVWLIFLNGMMLGAMSMVFHRAGLSVEWWAWIAGHGVTELWAVTLGGTAGLALARALIRPGRRSRRRALAETAPTALALALGAVPMLLVAALLEGFFRQSAASSATRFAVAAATALLWGGFFALAGRTRAATAATAAHAAPEARRSR